MNSTLIAGTLANALGSRAVTGSIRISWPSFTAQDGNFVPSGAASVPVAHDGSYAFELIPSDGSVPPMLYAAMYQLNSGSSFAPDHWEVPITGLTVTIAEILVQPGATQSSFSSAALPHVVAAANGATITASTHGQGQYAVAKFFTGTNAADVAYSRDGSGDITPDASFRGTVQIASGAYAGVSTPYTQSVPSPVSSLSITAATHGQGAYAVVDCFDSLGNAVAGECTRDSSGNLTLSFNPLFSGSVEVTAGGHAGSTVFLYPVTNASSASISVGLHGKGSYAVAACWSSDSPSVLVDAAYSRDLSGDLSFSFNPAFSGLIQVYSQQ